MDEMTPLPYTPDLVSRSSMPLFMNIFPIMTRKFKAKWSIPRQLSCQKTRLVATTGSALLSCRLQGQKWPLYALDRGWNSSLVFKHGIDGAEFNRRNRNNGNISNGYFLRDGWWRVSACWTSFSSGAKTCHVCWVGSAEKHRARTTRLLLFH